MKKPLNKLLKAWGLIDHNLPENEQREQLCNILLEELANLKGYELTDYLEFFGLDFIIPGIVINLKFPIQAHVFVPRLADIEFDRSETDSKF